MPNAESSNEDVRGVSSPDVQSHLPQDSATKELERQAIELIQANKDLLDSEQRLRLALATGQIGLWVWNSTDLNNSGDWSPRLKEIFGLPLETEVTHEIFLNCVHPEDRERVNKSIMDALGGIDGGAYAAEYRAIHERDGSEHWVTAKGQAFFNPEGQAIRFIGTVMDITERKREEELAAQLNSELQRRVAERTRDLQRSEAFLNQAQRLMKTGSVWWKVNTGEIVWSEETYRLMEYDRTTTPSLELIMNRVHPEDLPLVRETVTRSAQEGADLDFKHRLLMPDGTIKHIHVLIQNTGISPPDSEFLGAVSDITEQYQAQANLKEALAKINKSEDHLRIILETIPGLVSTMTPAGELDHASNQVIEFFGKTREELQNWLRYVHPDDRERLMTKWTRSLETGEMFDDVQRLLRADGQYRWFHSRSRGLRDECGRIVRWYNLLIDIDDQKKAEDELRRSTVYLTHAQQLSHTGSVGMRVPDGKISWSEESARIYGYAPTLQPTVEMVLQRVHPDDVEKLKQVFARAMEGGASFDFDHRLLMPDGTIKHIRNYAHSVKNEEGHEEVLGAIIDVSEQHTAQAKVEDALSKVTKSEANLRLILDGIPGLVSSRSAEGIPDFVNKRTLDFFGETLSQMSDWSPLIHDDDRDRVVSSWRRSVAIGQPFNCEFRARRADGVYRWLYSRVSPLRDAQGQILRWYNLLTDIDEQKKAEESLRRNQSYLAYAQALSHSGNAIVKVSTGTFLWSEETARIYGYDPTILEPTAEMLMQRIHPEDAAMVKDVLERALRGGVTLDFGHRLLMPDGSVKHLHAIAHTVKDEGGGEEVLGAIVDITKQKQIEEALRASDRLARGHAETLKEILSSMSTEVNPDKFLEHVLRVISQQMGGHSVSVFCRNDDDSLTLQVVYEDNVLHVSNENITYPTDDQPLWDECMRMGTECLLTEFDRDPIWLRFVNRKGSEGVPRLNEKTVPPVVEVHRQIKAQGLAMNLAIPMVTGGRVSGFIGLLYSKRREFLPEEIELCLSLAQQAALAMRLMQLSRESQETAIMAERNRMARDIHDTLAQGFTGIIAQLQAAKGSAQLTQASAHIENAENLARTSLDEARRSVRALRPLSLSNASICEALESMLKTVGHYSILRTELMHQGIHRAIPPEWEEVLLRVTQESLTNTIKHAKAQNFRATLNFEPEQVLLRLVDDGCGFVPQAEHEGFGLIGMKERVDGIGGDFVIHSQPGAGTETVITLPSPRSAQP